jgi:hypothetical protein
MELCVRVVEQVGANQEGQMPIGEPLQVKGHQAGQFVFHLREEQIETPAAPKPKPQIELSRGEDKIKADISTTVTEKPKTPFQYDKAMEYFTQNNTDAIFKLVDEYAKQNNDTATNTAAIILKSQYSELKKNEMLGLLSYQEESLTRNQINARLLQFLSGL